MINFACGNFNQKRFTIQNMSRRFHFPVLSLSLLSLFVVSCGGKAKVAADSAEAVDSAITVAEYEWITPELPDTAYESVKLISATTRIIDTVTDGKLSDHKDLYRTAPGIFAFRANAFRDAEMRGKVSGTPKEIVVDWNLETLYDRRQTGSSQGWGGGSGWTGQPVYVEWPDSLIKKYQAAGHLSKDFSGKEILVGSLSSYLYFIDFETGKQSREPLYVNNPIKGSVMLDPTLNGNVYLGQGIPNERPFGAIVVDLNTHTVSDTYPEDSKAPRHWDAYDSSAIRMGQFLFRPGENGTLYKFLVETGKQKLHSAMSYTAGGRSLGMEASMSIYGNYGYTADNSGLLVCTNLNTMKPVWVYDLGDDTDSSPVVTVEEGKPYIYTGSEIDKTSRGYSKYVKLNALDGSVVWEREMAGQRFDIGEKHFDGGFYATSLPGQGNCKDIIFVNVVENLRGQNGKFVALNRRTGETVYEIPLKHYAWSSPVGFLNENEEMFVLDADCAGRMYLIDGKKGELITEKIVGANFESSPVVSGNSAVVGSRGQYIYKVSLK